jgi:hypothetical protein
MLSSISKRKEMDLKRIFGLILLVFLVSSSLTVFQTVNAEQRETAKVFIDPPVVQSTGVGEEFTVEINVSGMVDLYGWQTGITFNPQVLECTGFYEGEFLKRPGGPTILLKHYLDMNNTLGIVYFRGCCLLGPVPGVNGSGQLAYVTFTSMGIGVSDFHLTDVMFLNSNVEDIAFQVVEGYIVSINGTNYGGGIADNLTGVADPMNPPLSGVFGTVFNLHDKKISFSVLATENWFCRVSIPKALLRCAALSDWTVRIDGARVSDAATENATSTVLYFTSDEGNHTVEIIGTETVGSKPLPGDLNSDFKVSLQDLEILAHAYGYKPGDAKWNSVADIDGNGIVGLSDLDALARCYGQHY